MTARNKYAHTICDGDTTMIGAPGTPLEGVFTHTMNSALNWNP